MFVRELVIVASRHNTINLEGQTLRLRDCNVTPYSVSTGLLSNRPEKDLIIILIIIITQIFSET